MTDGKRDACTCSSLGSEAVVADFLGAADLRRRGAPLLRISRRQHRALGPHSRAILKDSLAPLGSARAGNPAGPADACHRPRVRGLRRPSGSLYRSGSPSDRPDSVVFSHPLPDRSAILVASFTYAVSLPITSFTYAVSLPTVDEGPAIPAGTSLMRGIQKRHTICNTLFSNWLLRDKWP